MEEIFYTSYICIISLINLEILHCMTHMLWWVLVKLTDKFLYRQMRDISFKPCIHKKINWCPNLIIIISNHHRIDVIEFERNDAYVRCMRYISVLMA